jgi:hypothetical protein
MKGFSLRRGATVQDKSSWENVSEFKHRPDKGRNDSAGRSDFSARSAERQNIAIRIDQQIQNDFVGNACTIRPAYGRRGRNSKTLVRPKRYEIALDTFGRNGIYEPRLEFLSTAIERKECLHHD